VGLIISQGVRAKLSAKTPPVSEEDILQCFANRVGKNLQDKRAKNLTDPLTEWFIAETDYGRKLKVCYIPFPDKVVIRTAYDPDGEEIRIYRKYGENHV
jgi:hypothetical protein